MKVGESMKEKKIIISKNGPYIVKGGIPLSEMIITPGVNGNEYKLGRTFETASDYALCRCGNSQTMPFCDGSHVANEFDGTLTATREPISKSAVVYEGDNLILEDTGSLCAFARFCHDNEDNVWEATQNANDEPSEQKAIKLACDCPAGRLVITSKKTGQVIEPEFEPSIVLLQDPEKNCSGPIWVRGNVLIVDENDEPFEVRNRVTLCRCGESNNKPFCDATHIDEEFFDGYNNSN